MRKPPPEGLFDGAAGYPSRASHGHDPPGWVTGCAQQVVVRDAVGLCLGLGPGCGDAASRASGQPGHSRCARPSPTATMTAGSTCGHGGHGGGHGGGLAAAAMPSMLATGYQSSGPVRNGVVGRGLAGGQEPLGDFADRDTESRLARLVDRVGDGVRDLLDGDPRVLEACVVAEQRAVGVCRRRRRPCVRSAPPDATAPGWRMCTGDGRSAPPRRPGSRPAPRAPTC